MKEKKNEYIFNYIIIDYREPSWLHLFQLYSVEGMEVRGHLGDEYQGKQTRAISFHKRFWQVLLTRQPF